MKVPKGSMESIMATAIMDLIFIALAHAPKCAVVSCGKLALWENIHNVKMCDKHCTDYKTATPDELIVPVTEQKRLRKLAVLAKVYETITPSPLEKMLDEAETEDIPDPDDDDGSGPPPGSLN